MSSTGERINPHPMIDCPYYQGTGHCVDYHCGSLPSPEPLCITDQPLHGWRRRTPDGRFAPKETKVG